MTSESKNPQSPKTMVRSDDRMIAGVCAGVAEYFGIDTTLVRIVAVLSVLLGFGAGLLVYIAGWLIMPDRNGQTVITWRPTPSAPTAPPAEPTSPVLSAESAPPVPPAEPAPSAEGDDASEPPRQN